MHSLKARNAFRCADWLFVLDDPQAAIATAQLTAAIATTRMRRLGAPVSFALRMSREYSKTVGAVVADDR